MKRKPHYRWIESHGAWLLTAALYMHPCKTHWPLWLFPKPDKGADW